MSTWSITSKGEAREIYEVTADTEEEARAMFDRGDLRGPFLTEVSGSEIVEIEKVEDD